MKKLLAILLTVAMLFSVVSVIPVSAAADEVEAPLETVTEVTTEVQTDSDVEETEDSFSDENEDVGDEDGVFYAEKQRYVGDTSKDVEFEDVVKKDYDASFASELLSYVDIDSFKEYLINAFDSCPTSAVSIYKYRIPASKRNAVCNLIFYDTPQLFHIWNVRVDYKNDYLNTITVTEYLSFCDTATEYTSLMAIINESAKQLLKGIKNNNNLSSLQKMILLHDRIAANCEYNPNPDYYGNYRDEDYSMAGVFVDKMAVCQGYADAYNYLLRQIGIESYQCRSTSLNHAWNLVKVGSYYYHVDITWDDTGSPLDLKGRVYHDNFLRSNTGIYNTGHTAYDYDKPTNNSTYDSYFWQNSGAEFVLVENTVYYYDSTYGDLKTYSGAVKSNQATWSYGRILADGNNIYITTSRDVKKYNTATGATTTAYTPSLSSSHEIYGLYKSDGYIYCTTGSTSTSTQTVRQITQSQEFDELEANGSYTANITTGGQEKTFSFTPSQSGKYVIYSSGDNDTKVSLCDLNGNVITSDDDSGEGNNFRLEFDLNAGTTYLYKVRFYSGSRTGSINFNFGNVFTITYNANGGKNAPTSIVKDYQQAVVLSNSKPTRSGYIFLGWSTNRKATSATYKKGDTLPANVNSNTTLYAVWKKGSLGATAVLISKLSDYNTAKVSWREVAGADGYKIYWKRGSSKSYTYEGATQKLSYTKNLSASTKYTFKIVPYTDVGGKDVNGTAKTVTFSTSKNLAAPKKVNAVLYGYDDVKISWSKVSGAKAYYIYYKKSTSSEYTYLKRTTATSYKKANLADGVKYDFKVVPATYVNGKYLLDESYKTKSIYTLREVTELKIYNYTSSSVYVEWGNVLGETGYQVSQSTSRSGTNVVGAVRILDPNSIGGYYHNITSAKYGRTYYYKVRAYKTVNGKNIYGPWSDVVAFTNY